MNEYNVVYIHITEDYSAIKINEELAHSETWRNLKISCCVEGTSHKRPFAIYFRLWNIYYEMPRIGETIEIENR